MTVGYTALNTVAALVGWTTPTVPAGDYDASIYSAFAGPAPAIFDHWRIFRQILPADNLTGADFSLASDISGAQPAPLPSFDAPYIDNTADKTGASNFYWVVAYNADESLGGFCQQSEMLQGLPPTGNHGPFAYDGTMGGCFIDNVASATPPWEAGPRISQWLWTISGLPAQLSGNIGTGFALISNTATTADSWPPPQPQLPGQSECYQVHPGGTAATGGAGATGGFSSDDLPTPATQLTTGNRWAGFDPIPIDTMFLAIEAALSVGNVYASGTAEVNFLWQLTVNSPDVWSLPGGGFKPPARVSFSPQPQPVPLPCIPCCQSVCAMPVSPLTAGVL